MKQTYRSLRYIKDMYQWYRRHRSLTRWDSLRAAIADELYERRLTSGKSEKP